jgi:hypothetical protein
VLAFLTDSPAAIQLPCYWAAMTISVSAAKADFCCGAS